MSGPRLSKLEFQIMEALWQKGESSIRAVQEAFPERGRPAYTTVQTTMYRMETKGALERTGKIANFHLFSAAISRDAAQNTLIDDLLALLGGRAQPVMARLIDSGRLSLDDVKEAEKALKKASKKLRHKEEQPSREKRL